MAMAHLLRRVRRSRSTRGAAACPRCRLPMLVEPGVREVHCAFCGATTPRELLAARRGAAQPPPVHFHRGPEGRAAPCFDRGCASPRLSPADAAALSAEG